MALQFFLIQLRSGGGRTLAEATLWNSEGRTNGLPSSASIKQGKGNVVGLRTLLVLCIAAVMGHSWLSVNYSIQEHQRPQAYRPLDVNKTEQNCSAGEH